MSVLSLLQTTTGAGAAGRTRTRALGSGEYKSSALLDAVASHASPNTSAAPAFIVREHSMDTIDIPSPDVALAADHSGGASGGALMMPIASAATPVPLAPIDRRSSASRLRAAISAASTDLHSSALNGGTGAEDDLHFS
jgi:hypothetical protein